MSKLQSITVLAVSLLLATIVMACCSGEQQTNKALDDAVALAQQGDQAILAQDWAGYSALAHPDDLARFKSSLLLELERLAMARQTDSITVFDQPFAMDDLREKSPEEFFGDIMVIVFRVSPELGKSFSNMKNDFIGAIAENDSLIHVVATSKILLGTKHVEEMEITSVKLHEDAWKLRLSSKIQGISLMLQQSLQMQQR